MTISSDDEPHYYSTSESLNLLNTAKRLRKDIVKLRVRASDEILFNKLLKSLDAFDDSLTIHIKEIQMLENVLEITNSIRFTEKQRRFLIWLSEEYDEAEVYTKLIDRISKKLDIPKSTVRWNLRGLREAGLIEAGDKDNKGIPVRFTKKGKIMVQYFSEYLELVRKHI